MPPASCESRIKPMPVLDTTWCKSLAIAHIFESSPNSSDHLSVVDFPAMKLPQFISLSALLGIAFAMDDAGGCERSTTVLDFETLPDGYEDFETARRLPDGTILDGLANRLPDGFPDGKSPTQSGAWNDILVTSLYYENDRIISLAAPYDEPQGGLIVFKLPQEVDLTQIRFRDWDADDYIIGKDASNRIVAKEKLSNFANFFEKNREKEIDDISFDLTAFRGVKKLVVKFKKSWGAISSFEYSSCKGTL